MAATHDIPLRYVVGDLFDGGESWWIIHWTNLRVRWVEAAEGWEGKKVVEVELDASITAWYAWLSRFWGGFRHSIIRCMYLHSNCKTSCIDWQVTKFLKTTAFYFACISGPWFSLSCVGNIKGTRRILQLLHCRLSHALLFLVEQFIKTCIQRGWGVTGSLLRLDQTALIDEVSH